MYSIFALKPQIKIWMLENKSPKCTKFQTTISRFPFRVPLIFIQDPSFTIISLRWRHNDHNGISNHQPHHCLFNCLFGRTSKKTSKLRVTGLCAGNLPGPVNSPYKWPVTRKMFPFDDVITLPADVLVPNSARPLAGTVLFIKQDVFYEFASPINYIRRTLIKQTEVIKIYEQCYFNNCYVGWKFVYRLYDVMHH